MPAWFSKVFEKKREEVLSDAAPEETDGPVVAEDFEDIVEEEPAPRRIVEAPVLVDEEEVSGWSEGVRIKAKLEPMGESCTFLVDRPVLEGYSLWCPDKDTAYAISPLAAAVFDAGGVQSVLIHDLTVTVTRDGTGHAPWKEKAAEYGQVIREHLKAGKPVADPDYMANMPSEEEIRAGLQRVIDEEINPGIAAHSGLITLKRVKGNTAYITMGGGCQGCAASTITLRMGIENAFRQSVPQVGAILDETDHAAGTNPYFSELPPGMGM